MKFKGSLSEFNNYIRNRKDLKFRDIKDVIDTYKQEIHKITNKSKMFKDLFENKIKSKCMVKSVPKYSEKFMPEAYYMPGDLELKRQGKFYINGRSLKEMSKIEVEALTLHEVVAGHHYQISYSYESNLPLFIKSLSNDAYHEGWALYCESLGEYKTYESYYGKLVMEMIRSLRLVLDTGIHYYGWSFKKAFNYYKKYGFETDDQIKHALLRYIAIPSQALSYKMGEKFFLDCVKKIKSKDKIKHFHKIILESGPIPLSILKSLISSNSKLLN